MDFKLEIDFNMQVYDFDTRIHLLIKGPGIAPGSSFDFLASNVDLAPTMLSLADIPRPPGAMRQTKQQPPSFSLSGVPLWYQQQPFTDLSRQARDERKGKWTEGSVLFLAQAWTANRSFLWSSLLRACCRQAHKRQQQRQLQQLLLLLLCRAPCFATRMRILLRACGAAGATRTSSSTTTSGLADTAGCSSRSSSQTTTLSPSGALMPHVLSCLVLSCLAGIAEAIHLSIAVVSSPHFVFRVHVVRLRLLCAQEGRPLRGRRHALR